MTEDDMGTIIPPIGEDLFAERPVGEAATDGSLFRPSAWYRPDYRRHMPRPPRGPMLKRADTYTSLALVRVVRCAWLETFGPRCQRQTSVVVAQPHPMAGTVISRERCKHREGHIGPCQLEST